VAFESGACVGKPRVDHVALELGKGGHHVQQQLVGGRETPFPRGDDQQFDSRLAECVEDVDAVTEAASEAVEAAGGDFIDIVISNMLQQALKGWPIRAGPGPPASSKHLPIHFQVESAWAWTESPRVIRLSQVDKLGSERTLQRSRCGQLFRWPSQALCV